MFELQIENYPGFFLTPVFKKPMSLIPPAPLILSKLKYHIKNRMKDDPDMDRILQVLGPYYLFKLTANFRSLENGTCNELEDIGTYIQSGDAVRWDCIDTALNMFTRMKGYLKTSLTAPGVLRLAICHQPDGALAGSWSDMFVDEMPINVKGIRDEKGKELTL